MIQRMLFYLSYPLIIIYAPLFTRARVLIVHGDEFLAVKGRFSDSNWHLPGGGVKSGESRIQAAVREVKEEVGISLTEQDLSTLIPYGFYRNQGLIYRGEIFVTRLTSKKTTFDKNSEIAEFAWLPTDARQPGLGKIVSKSLKRL